MRSPTPSSLWRARLIACSSSLSRQSAGVTPNPSRRLSKPTYKGPTHPVAVTETYFARYSGKRVSAVFYHHPCGLNAQVLNCFSRGLASFLLKSTMELAGTEARGFGKPLNRQWGVQIATGIIQRALDAIRLRFEFKQRRMLCLAARRRW